MIFTFSKAKKTIVAICQLHQLSKNLSVKMLGALASVSALERKNLKLL